MARSRAIWNSCLLLALLGGGLYLYSTYVPEPATVPLDEYYRIGTAGKFKDIPSPRQVVLEDGLSKTDSGQASLEVQGIYHTGKRLIGLDRRLAHSGLYLQQVLPHEYGHAFLHEFLDERYGRNPVKVSRALQSASDMRLENIETLLRKKGSYVPKELRPLVKEYQRGSEKFGAYASQNFAEWFAEAFKAYVNDKSLPAATKEFLKTASHMSNDKKSCSSCHEDWN